MDCDRRVQGAWRREAQADEDPETRVTRSIVVVGAGCQAWLGGSIPPAAADGGSIDALGCSSG